MSTFKNRWAAVSGYVEDNEDALKRAFIEIQEEVGLSPKNIKLLKSSKPVYIRSKDVLWVVYPFLFSTNTTKIKLDWEHSKYEWLSVNDFLKLRGTVPKLKDAFLSAFSFFTKKRKSGPKEKKKRGANAQFFLFLTKKKKKLVKRKRSGEVLSHLTMLAHEFKEPVKATLLTNYQNTFQKTCIMFPRNCWRKLCSCAKTYTVRYRSSFFVNFFLKKLREKINILVQTCK